MPALLDKPQGWFIAWLRKVWLVRGGGLYAFGFACTFVLLELQSLADDVLGIGSLFNGQAVEFIVQLFVDSILNTLRSFAWPLYILGIAPPWGALLLALAFVAFARWCRAPIECRLFPDGVPARRSKRDRKKRRASSDEKLT